MPAEQARPRREQPGAGFGVCRRLAIAVLALACPLLAGADPWSFTLPAMGGAHVEIPVPTDALLDAAALQVQWKMSAGPETVPNRWLEIAVITGDGRWFTSADLPPLHAGLGGQRRLPLDAGAWSGSAGRFGGDAARTVQHVRVSVHGGTGAESVSGMITVLPVRGAPTLVLEQVGSGLVQRTARAGETGVDVPRWQEWRLRLLGDVRGEWGTVRFVGAAGTIPAFLEQPGGDTSRGWQAQGPARWVFRLRPGEAGRVGRIEWQQHAAHWESAEVQIPALVTSVEVLPNVPDQAYSLPEVPAWHDAVAMADHGDLRRAGYRDAPAALAPILRWRADWTGFRGLLATSPMQGQALDAHLAQAVVAFDLLPQGLVEEQGPFRFGENPVHVGAAVPCAYPQDWWSTTGQAEVWLEHAREVIARVRAVPELTTWTAGMTNPANDAAQLTQLHTVATQLAALANSADDRPLLLRHPQLVTYRYRAEDPPWGSFETGADGWTRAPWPGVVAPMPGQDGSDGVRSLLLPLTTVGEVRIGAAQREIGANVANLDRLEYDVRLDAAPGVSADCYAWVTDRHHRWYQMRVQRVLASPRWMTLGINFDAGAPWEPVGHALPWTGDQRRQLRQLGLAVFVHGDRENSAAFRIDRIRRLGWPEALPVTLTIERLTVVAEPSARATPIAVDFELSEQVRNPFDPDYADVVGEVEGPQGQRLRYPAYWSEPMTLAFADGTETVTPAGNGGWHWRFSPPTAGAWRWRIVARLTVQDQECTTTSAWRTTQVPDAWPKMPPVRPDPQDPTWCRRDDGTFWYPLGANLRSPGDTRQDRVLVMEAAGKSPPRRNPDVLSDPLPGWVSSQYERLGTVAFERWLRQFSAHGMNWARVWMCPWWCGLEWSREWDEYGGLLVYNQHAAARLDRVLEIAEREGVYVQLELQNHGMTSDFVDQQWNPDRRGNPGSPYSISQGGMCRSPGEFYSNESAWQHQEKRLRYIQARWGYHRAIAALVLSSEMEFTGDWKESRAFSDDDLGHSPVTQAWIARNLAWFRANDPLHRAVSIHFSHPWRASRLWQMDGLGFSNSNAYTGFQEAQKRLGGPGAGLARAFEIYLGEHYPPTVLKRPTLIGEWGGHWERNERRTLAAELHTGLWMQAVLPYGGNTGFWWWMWIDAADAWSEYGNIARFVRDWDPRGQAWRMQRPLTGLGVVAVGMQSETSARAYVWREGLDRTLALPELVEAGSITWRVAPDTTWTVTRWNTNTGTADQPTSVTATGEGLLVVPLGKLRDAAFVLKLVSGG